MRNDISTPNTSPFLEQVRQVILCKHYSIKTEHTYLRWIKNFIHFHNKRHPLDMGADEVGAYLNHLAIDRHVAPATQRTALNALVFMYREVLKRPIEEAISFTYANKPPRIPTVFPIRKLALFWRNSKIIIMSWPLYCTALVYG